MLASSDVNAPAEAKLAADQPAASDVDANVAAGVTDPSIPASAQPAGSTAASDWHFSVSPYLWIPWVYGTIGANGHDAKFYTTPGELFSHFRFGLLGVVETDYKRVVVPVDFIWLRLGDDKALANIPAESADVKVDAFILTPKVGYRVIDLKMLKIDALAGFRFWHLGQNLQFNSSILGFNLSGSQNWVDPLVGGRIVGLLSPKVEVTIGGDVGGWGVGSQLDYQTFALLGYRIKPALVLQAGYRYLSVDYTNGTKIFDSGFSGPLLGVTINLK